MKTTLEDIAAGREKFENRRERKRQENRPARYGEKGTLNEIGIGITNMYGTRSNGTPSKHRQYSILALVLKVFLVIVIAGK